MHVTIFQTSLISILVPSTSLCPAHEVRQRARCHNCGVKGNNTYQIVYTGNSEIAMDGAANTHASPADTFQN